jgi:hypothetical protein
MNAQIMRSALDLMRIVALGSCCQKMKLYGFLLSLWNRVEFTSPNEEPIKKSARARSSEPANALTLSSRGLQSWISSFHRTSVYK